MNRKQKANNIRKISEIGKGSLGITLPAEYVAKLGWKNKQLVKVLLKGRSLIIRDWRPSAKATRTGGKK